MKRTLPLLAALALAGCAGISTDAALSKGLAFTTTAASYGAVIDGKVTAEESPAYIRAAVEVFGDAIPARYVGTIIIACQFLDIENDLDAPVELTEFCDAVNDNIPEPA